MKAGWEVKKLGELCEVVYGTRVVNKKHAGTKFPVYGGGGATFYMDEFNREDQLVVSRFGMSEQCSRFVRGKFFLNDSGLTLAPRDRQNLSQQFLDFQIQFLNDRIYVLGRGTAQKNLDIPAFREIELSYPSSRVEQLRIAGMLTKAFAVIAKAKENAERNLQNSRDLFESYLQQLGGEKTPLGELVEIRTGKLDANAAKEDGQYPFFTCSRVIYAIDTFAFDTEAILLAGNNAVGDFNVKHYNGKFNAYQRTYVINVNEKRRILYRYLYFQLLRSLKEFKSKSVGAGTKFLKLGMIRDLEVVLPSIFEQQAIVNQLDALSAETKKLETIYQKKLADLEELKKSILQKAFNGELTGTRA